MATNGKFLSKDGQWYDTAQEVWSANSAWNEKQGIQKEQNRLLQQQNQLLQQQNELNYQIEQEKIQKNYELEMNKMKHKEKMRLLKLFDDVGISKEIYDNYINTNILNKETEKLQSKRNKHLLMSSKYDFLLHKNEYWKEHDYDQYDEIMEKYDLYDLEEKLESDCYDKVSQKKQDEIDMLKEKVNKLNNYANCSFVICFFFLVACMWFISNDIWYSSIILWFIGDVITVILFLVANSNEKKLKSMPKQTFNEKKYISKLNNLVSKEIADADKCMDSIKTNTKQYIDDLYEFRIKHYNSSIEKLLIDVGFKELIEDLGLEYKRVNNSNKKKDGTIEDYIEYFETNS